MTPLDEAVETLRRYLAEGEAGFDKKAVATCLRAVVNEAHYEAECIREYAVDAGKWYPISDGELSGFIRRALRLYDAAVPRGGARGM